MYKETTEIIFLKKEFMEYFNENPTPELKIMEEELSDKFYTKSIKTISVDEDELQNLNLIFDKVVEHLKIVKEGHRDFYIQNIMWHNIKTPNFCPRPGIFVTLVLIFD